MLALSAPAGARTLPIHFQCGHLIVKGLRALLLREGIDTVLTVSGADRHRRGGLG